MPVIKTILVLSALLACCLIAACGPELTQEQVRQAYADAEQMFREGDIDQLRALFWPDAQIQMVNNGVAESYPVEDYLELNRRGMLLLDQYSISSTIDEVVINGSQATVRSTVQESGVLLGRPVRTRTQQTMLLSVRRGELRIESVRGVIESQ
ncbi:MAG: nuclear transport factor 2 family protein [Candidatus Alcyoniella australis]|nr:nuclear transport factor 2 family protein [Candidatus Alcyoniella australis]